MLKIKLTSIILSSFILTACTIKHQADIRAYDGDPPLKANIDERINVAAQTCETQNAAESRTYLSAVQDLVAQAGHGGAANAAMRASLDQFREEIIAAHRTVVMRCKTHMQCLEANRYVESKCYMAAADRKDAEREFRLLAYELRDLEREVKLAEIDSKKTAAKAKKKPPKITVETNVTQTNNQQQDVQVGDDVADKDVLVATCGIDQLLSRECREQCRDGKRC
ncbi:MAG: hypothetical protein Kow00133_13030 [Amphiplicatus sp.]